MDPLREDPLHEKETYTHGPTRDKDTHAHGPTREKCITKTRDKDTHTHAPARDDPRHEEHSCGSWGFHYVEYQNGSHVKEVYTEVLSMLPGEVCIEEPEQTYVEEPPHT